MAPIFPRTTREFLQHRRVVVVHCVSGCGHRAPQDPESLILTFGEDFDLIAGVAEVAATLYCPVCGTRKPNIYFLGGPPVVAESLEALTRKAS